MSSKEFTSINNSEEGNNLQRARAMEKMPEAVTRKSPSGSEANDEKDEAVPIDTPNRPLKPPARQSSATSAHQTRTQQTAAAQSVLLPQQEIALSLGPLQRLHRGLTRLPPLKRMYVLFRMVLVFVQLVLGIVALGLTAHAHEESQSNVLRNFVILYVVWSILFLPLLVGYTSRADSDNWGDSSSKRMLKL
ncbi:hypothetical protein EV175_005485 [Coemansia sp. RSA 1933]|nr:hypothetical protein EV175_005485 [Coemansia sp. RSA 1933]